MAVTLRERRGRRVVAPVSGSAAATGAVVCDSSWAGLVCSGRSDSVASAPFAEAFALVEAAVLRVRVVVVLRVEDLLRERALGASSAAPCSGSWGSAVLSSFSAASSLSDAEEVLVAVLRERVVVRRVRLAGALAGSSAAASCEAASWTPWGSCSSADSTELWSEVVVMVRCTLRAPRFSSYLRDRGTVMLRGGAESLRMRLAAPAVVVTLTRRDRSSAQGGARLPDGVDHEVRTPGAGT